MERFTLRGLGRRRPGFSAERVLANLARIFRQPPERLAQLLERPLNLRRDLTAERAQQYLAALRQAGLEVEARLQPEPALLRDHLVRIGPETGRQVAAAPLTYQLDLRRLVPHLAAPPAAEPLRCSTPGGRYRVVSHRWQVSPTLAVLAALFCSLVAQQYLLQLWMAAFPEGLMTLLGLLVLVAPALFLPTLLRVGRLLSLHPGDAEEPDLLMVQRFTIHPLRCRYRLHRQGVAEGGELHCHRYRPGEARWYDSTGRLALYLEEGVADDAVADMAGDLRQGIAGLGWLDRAYTMLAPLARRMGPQSAHQVRQQAERSCTVRSADGAVLATAYRGAQGLIELPAGARPGGELAPILLLALVGLGVY